MISQIAALLLSAALLVGPLRANLTRVYRRHPEKMGVAISDGLTIVDAQTLGARWVLLYWPKYNDVQEAVDRNLNVVVGIPDCNVPPVRWSQLARISQDFPTVSFYFLNEPDLWSQAGASCADHNKIGHLYMAFSHILQLYGAQDLYWGNTSVGDTGWMAQFDFPRDHIGTHIYTTGNPDDYNGWRQRLDGVLAFANGDVIITEIGSQGSSDRLALFNYLADMIDSEPRVKAWMWWNGPGSELVVNGQLTALGQAYRQRTQP